MRQSIIRSESETTSLPDPNPSLALIYLSATILVSDETPSQPIPPTSTTKSIPNLPPHTLHHFMIPRIRRRLIQKANRLPIQSHPLTLEPQIPNPRLILLAIPEIILEKQIQTPHAVEQRPLDRHLLDLRCLRQMQRLCWWKRVRGAEIQIVAVDEEEQCSWCARRGRCT